MAEQARQTDSYEIAAHVYATFLGQNDELTPTERQHSSVQPFETDSPSHAREIQAYRTVGGVSMIGQILRPTADGDGFELITKPKYRGDDHVTRIWRYGRDPLRKVAGSMFVCELVHIVNERTE